MNGKREGGQFGDLRKLLGMPETEISSTRKTGIVKKVLANFGFIKVEGERDDIYFAFRSFITPVKAGQVQEGMKVSFEVGPGQGGKPAAINIEILEMPKTAPYSKQQAPERMPQTSGEHYFLPRDTRKALDAPLTYQNRGKPEQQIDNFSLLLNKCAYEEGKGEGKFSFYLKDKYELQPAFPLDMTHSVAMRHRIAIRMLGLNMADIRPQKIDWRLIVGLGNESVYETSMTLHHIYGIPYIPGQSVKGVLRSWCLLEYFNTVEEDGLRQKWFCDLFGCPKEKSYYKEARQGNMRFFDAFPIDLKPEHIQPDIMNPHYSKYYSEGKPKPPADWQDPVPVNFLTVQGATFEFFVGITAEKNIEITEKESPFYQKTLLAVVQEQLPMAFSMHGLGAKTAVGYGYFTEQTR